MWVMSPNLRIKLDKKFKKKKEFWAEKGGIFYWEENVRGERERVEREAPTSLYNLWSSVAWFSSDQERKFIYSTRATHGYQKHGISPRIQVRNSGNQRFRV